MTKKLLFAGVVALGMQLTGCTEEYAPETGSNGENMFTDACMGCHKAKEELSQEAGKPIFFSLSAGKATVAAISEKVRGGGMIMPKFPNIPDEQLASLAQFALDHSIIEE